MTEKTINKNITEGSTELNVVDSFAVAKKMHAGFCLGQAIIEPDLGVVIRDSERYHLPPKAMEILVFLASKNCSVVSRDEILEFGWGDANASGSNVTHIISEIRHALDDHIECPVYIQTIPRKGYRMMLTTIEKPESGIFNFGANSDSTSLTSSKWHLSLAIFKSSRLFKSSAAYVVISWVLLQVFALVFPIFHAPTWAVKFATLVIIIGFPIFIGYQWLQELKVRRKILLSKENKNKYFYQQLSIDGFFVSIVIAVIYYLSTHLINFIDFNSEQPIQTAEYIPTMPVVDNAIAVLPFTTQGSGGNAIPQYIVSGLQEELIHSLSQKPSFRVASLRAIKSLDQDASIETIKLRLGVRYIVEGKVRKLDEKIIINASLIDTSSGFQVWNGDINDDVNQSLTLYSELSRTVINALHWLLPNNGAETAIQDQPLPTKSFEAYDTYLQGKSAKEDFFAAEKLFIKALELDPTFVNASAALCSTYINIFRLNGDPAYYHKGVDVCDITASYKNHTVESYVSIARLHRNSGKQQEAITLLNKALAIDSTSVDALLVLADVYFDIESFELAEQTFLKAIEIEPSYWHTYYRYGAFLYSTGEYRRAITQFNKVNLLNEKIPRAYNALGGVYFLLMEWENASIAWSKALAIQPSARVYSNLATSLFFLQKFDNAAEIYLQGTKITPNDNIIWGNLGDSYKYSDTQQGKARGAYQTALDLALVKQKIDPSDEALQSQIARYYSELGHCSFAETYRNKAIVKQSIDPYIYYSLALVALNCDQLNQAREMIDLTIKHGYSKQLLLADPQFLAYKEQLSNLFSE